MIVLKGWLTLFRASRSMPQPPSRPGPGWEAEEPGGSARIARLAGGHGQVEGWRFP